MVSFLSSKALSQSLEFYKGVESEFVDTSFYRAVKDKPGLKCKCAIVGRCLEKLSLLPGHIQQFFMKHSRVYILPIEDLAAIPAIYYRSAEGKEFRMQIAGVYFYGLFRFKSFKYGDPVFVTEGIKDAEAMALHYPYSVAVLGGTISQGQMGVLKRLTSKIIFVVDNDKWGKRNAQSLLRKGVRIARPPVKDIGMRFEGHEEEVDRFLRTIVKIYGGKNGVEAKSSKV